MKAGITSLFFLVIFFLGCKPDRQDVLPEPPAVTKPILIFGNTATHSPSGFGLITHQTDRFTKNSSGTWIRSQMLPTGSPWSCYGGGILFTASHLLHSNGTISRKDFFAIDISTGIIKWEILNYDKFFSTPVFRNDTIFVPLSANNKTYIAAIDAKTGTFFWEQELAGNLPIHTLSLESQTAFFSYSISTAPPGSATTHYYAGVGSFNLNTKTINWSKDLDIQGVNEDFSIILDAPKIYVNSNRTLLCLSKSNGQTIWSKPAFFSEIKFQSGMLFTIMGTASNHGVYALNADSGDEIWKKMMGPGSLIYRIAESSDRIIVPLIGSRLVCLNRNTGSQLWEVPTNFNVHDAEILEGMLIIRRTTSDAYIFYNLENGNKTDSLIIHPNFFQKAYIVEEGGKFKRM